MARYLLSVRSSTSLAALSDLAAPADYLVDHVVERDANLGDAHLNDGLDRWEVDVQIAGVVADWVKAPAYDAFWDYLEAALRRLEVRPRGDVAIRSRTDAKRVHVTFDYFGEAAVARAREELRTRLATLLDPKTKKLTGDLELRLRG